MTGRDSEEIQLLLTFPTFMSTSKALLPLRGVSVRDIRMPKRINLDLFLESKNNNNICRLIMDVRICSEIQTLLKSHIFISSGDITITLFLLEFREIQIS